MAAQERRFYARLLLLEVCRIGELNPDRVDEMAALGEFVLVEDGRCGVLVVPPQTGANVLALWFGELVEEEPVVELVEPTAVRRVESTEVPGYYH